MSEFIVQTKAGKIGGRERNGLLEYLGIPFAEPPVGPLRFRRAVPKAPWTGVLDAAAYGSESLQFQNGAVRGSEDCLTLNIRRPLAGDRLPVLVWIHGGGYNTGSAADPLYDGVHFAQDGIVYVSIQYRLNVLGFYDFTTYPGGGAFESNCGLSDQILALQWVHENIAAFGGDPERVTIAGESAGGVSVLTLMAAPAARGCFQQVIAESALPNCVMTHETARENIDLFLEGLGWTEADLPRLLTEDPATFLPGNEYVARRHQYKNPGIFLPGPVQDDLLPLRPIEALRAGSARGVRLIIGTNMHESTMFVRPENTNFPNSWAMIAAMLEKNGCADGLPRIVNYYHPAGANRDAGDVRQNGIDPFIRFGTDYAFQMPSLQAALAQRQHAEDVWMYRYELSTAAAERVGLRAGHALEMPAVFVKRDFELTRFVFDGEPEELFDRISREMHGAWTRFVRTGAPDEVHWPRFTGEASPVRIFDRETRTECLDRSALLRTWDGLRFYEK